MKKINLYIKNILLFVFLFYVLMEGRTQESSDSVFNKYSYDNIINDENPLLEMLGKPFAEYYGLYMALMGNLLHDDSLSRVELVRLYDEAAKLDKSGEWKLLYDMIDNTVQFYESRKGGYTWSDDYTAEKYSDRMVEIANEAGKKGFIFIKIYALYNAAEGYRVFLQNYERAFACYLEATAEMESISSKEFPPRSGIYNQIANMYFSFREYNEAINFYNKVVEDPDINDYFPALNGLGLCYRNGDNDYDRSDSYFKQLIEETNPEERNTSVWVGIAEGNIGFNFYLRGDYDTALTWLKSSVERIDRKEDFGFVSNRALNVAEIYLIKNQPAEAKKYIDKAIDFYKQLRLTEKRSNMYEVLFQYYSYIGNRNLAELYHDSTLMAKDRENQTYSGLVLRHIEQQLRTSDKKVHEQELNNERIKNNLLMRTIIFGSIALAIILSLLWVVFVLYYRKRSAYRELVRQNQSWAGLPDVPEEITVSADDEVINIEPVEGVEYISEPTTIGPDDSDKLIMESIEKIMSEKELYKRNDLSLDILSAETGINRYYISLALNRCSGKNFNGYVNEYRIKEAIRIMSEPANKNLTIDAIAFDAGFNDRQSFHRVFKNKTGLSPGDFRKNT
ncbi:AraC family transcriptional regulator [Bacteroidales bacterium OttesenSCG-928-K03]|nr:AraC family transcriptional regulator [Odoribacter sp. OttesenSCG-928-L07]MDL2239395.1 AraC family transcriptional regulator [Bacteroidales bacterium OttesenSCG-928-L14]MDL2240745.1 AraC family transcriptional regulator [Bacteroidales bacterium OttesenSCG-928-K22]MDL2242740.1 AraC family transcriptional regulator [Bacteroidales bacterium OttesenSCG-928-K03]